VAVFLCEAIFELPMLKFLAVACVAFALAAGNPVWAQADAAGAKLAEQCVACHGPGGNSQNPDFPVLAGQSWRYIYIQLKDFKEGRRNDPVMSAMAAGLSRDDMIALGNYFAAVKPLPIAFKADGAKVEAGRKISDAVLCPMCHLGGFVGQNEIPKVAGQYPQYIKKQLLDFRAKRRTNDAGNMTSVAGTLSDDDIENLTQYIANL
jgi:cytochrome c553